MALIQARKISKHFRMGSSQLDVLKDVDLEIGAGEKVAILGPSGAGKSTLLNILGTLEKASAGELRIGDRDLQSLDDVALSRFRNRTIGFVFQFHHLLPEFDAVENVMLPALIGGLNRSDARKKALALLDEVGLSARLNHRPAELSGGEQQRVALARALSMDPKMLLADEPTGNLDAATSDGIHQLLLQANKERGVTLVMVTHNLALADLMERTLHMADGLIVGDSASSN